MHCVCGVLHNLHVLSPTHLLSQTGMWPFLSPGCLVLWLTVVLLETDCADSGRPMDLFFVCDESSSNFFAKSWQLQ